MRPRATWEKPLEGPCRALPALAVHIAHFRNRHIAFNCRQSLSSLLALRSAHSIVYKGADSENEDVGAHQPGRKVCGPLAATLASPECSTHATFRDFG